MSKLAELLKEIREMKTSVDKVENIVETRLVGVEPPLKDEVRAIQKYEDLKRKGNVEYIPLGEALKSLGINRTSRKARR